MKLNKFAKRAIYLALVFALILSISLPAFASTESNDPTTVTVQLMAAASMRYSLGERVNGQYPSGTLLEAFERQYGIKVNVTYESSGNLLNAMIADTTRSADVFISADLARMSSAVTANIIDGSTVYNLLNNKLVLIARADSGLTAGNPSYSNVYAWLTNSNYSGRTMAIGDPAVVPAGSYTQTVINRAYNDNGATWNNITTNPNLSTLYGNVTEVLEAVAANKNTIGSVYATDAATKTNLVELAREDVAIIYPIGITTAAMVKDVIEDEDGDEIQVQSARELAAQALVAYLKADIAKTTGSVFKTFGFSAA